MTRLRTTAAIIAALALSISLAAGVGAQDEPEAVGVFSIEDMTWLLTGQVAGGEMMPVPDRIIISLLMEDGNAGGSGGCNSYFTSYELDGFDLTFGPVGSTMMACLPPLMEAEQAYFANLSQVAAYQSGGVEMALLDANAEVVLEFELAPAATVVGSWAATGINNQTGGVVSQDITTEVTAEFSADGDLTGFDGCNDYFTSYVVDGDSITVDPMIASTMMACSSDELTEQSQQYLAALTSATTWSVDAAGNLELRGADGALQVGYAPAP